ncbi:MAG: phosphoribosylglycinamide formyltransferase [Candidatus Omnitrophota bacterium]
MRIAVFCSGNGTNLQAIIDAVKRRSIRACLALVVADNPDAYALTRATRAGIRTFVLTKEGFPTREAYDAAVIKELKKEKIDLVVLAGFMRLLSARFVRQYRNRILNIHPSLLPAFKGAHGIDDALAYGVKVTGVTVHVVDEGLDSGPIVLQVAIPVGAKDTEATLAARIHRQEHILYPRAIKLFVERKLKITGRKVFIT